MTTNILTNEDYKKIDELGQQLKKDPTNLNLLMQKAYVYYQGYDDDNAVKTYTKIIEFYPNYVDAYFWLSYYLYLVAADMIEAIKIANKGLKIDPNRGDLYAVIAWAIGEQAPGKEKDEFLYNMKKSIELDPTWVSTRISLIDFFIINNKFDEARKEIKETEKYIHTASELKAKSDIEKYYENHVTRRFSDSTKNDLKKFLEEIKLKKNINY